MLQAWLFNLSAINAFTDHDLLNAFTACFSEADKPTFVLLRQELFLLLQANNECFSPYELKPRRKLSLLFQDVFALSQDNLTMVAENAPISISMYYCSNQRDMLKLKAAQPPTIPHLTGNGTSDNDIQSILQSVMSVAAVIPELRLLREEVSALKASSAISEFNQNQNLAETYQQGMYITVRVSSYQGLKQLVLVQRWL